MFFTFSKLYKWYQIVQRVTYLFRSFLPRVTPQIWSTYLCGGYVSASKTGRKLNWLSTDHLRLAYNVLNNQPLKTATKTNILKETCTYVILDILTPPFWSQMGSKVFWKLHFHWSTNSSHYKISHDVILGAFTVRKSPTESIVLLQFFNSWVNSRKPSNVYCW